MADAVIEKSLVDIDLKGGLDESGPEESINWQKRLTKAENVCVDNSSLIVRPGLQLMDSDTGGTTLRMGQTSKGLGIISTDSSGLPNLGVLNQAGTNVDSKGNLPEFSVVSVGSGGEQVGVALHAGVCGVVSFTKFKAIAYYGSPPGAVTLDSNSDGYLDTSARVIVAVIDLKTGATVRRYVLSSSTATSYNVHMVGADDRYLHVYRTAVGGSLKPALTVIDTDSLPAETATLTFTDLTGTSNDNLIAGVVPIVGGSVVATQGTTTRIERFNNTAVSQDTATSTVFTNATGIDTDGTNYYIVGVGAYGYDPAVLALTAWWTDFAAVSWVGKASAGTSASQDATFPGNNPSAGATQNSQTTADFDGTNDNLLCDDTLATYVTASAASGWVLFNADTADAAGTNTNEKPCFFAEITGDAGFAVGYNTNGFEVKVRIKSRRVSAFKFF